MLYFDFACSFTKTTEKVWRKRGFFKPDKEINFNKVNNYIDLLLDTKNDIVFRFYALENAVLKGVCKFDYKKICHEKPESVLKTALNQLIDNQNLKITATEITLETYLKRAQWGESLLEIRSPRNGKLVKIENTYLTEFSGNVTELLIDKFADYEDEMLDKAMKLFISANFVEEIERIYQTEFLKGFYGHPLHYIIENENQRRTKNIIEVLTGALYAKGRVKSRRITIIYDLDLNIFEFEEDNFEALLKDNEGGTVTINFKNSDDFYVPQNIKMVNVFWNKINEYKNKVQFIFINLPRELFVRDGDGIRLNIISNGIIDNTGASIYAHDVIADSYFKEVTNTFNYDMLLKKNEWSIAEIDKLIEEWQASILRIEIFKLYY